MALHCVDDIDTPFTSSDHGWPAEGNPDVYICTHRHVPFRGYVVDFLCEVFDDYFAIECDGFDYHERTKQQAAYDRSRDRELLIAGVPTLRFTGSEIHADAHRCAMDVIALAVFIRAEQEAWRRR